VRSGTLLPSSANLKINFQAINLRAVHVKVSRIYENNILQFLQDNSLGSTDGSLRRVGKPIARKVIALDHDVRNSLHDWNTYALDLASLITPEPGAIYRVEIGMKKNYSLYACEGQNTEPLDLSYEQKSLNDDDVNYNEYYYDDDEDYWGYSENPCDEEYYYNKKAVTMAL